jgi:hypothetical protein
MSRYFAVIGNRDYIKYKGERRPYWEFLDEQPDGWLTSLAYQRKDLPSDRQIIFDCGAWSYKDKAVPKLGRDFVTPRWALNKYRSQAKRGDLLIAPDHMLIERFGGIEYRRHYNRKSACEFLRLAAGMEFTPMATVHGLDLDERIGNALWLAEIGYKAVALGGMAGRASAKRDNTEAVCKIRILLPDVHLHVLGLSSPDYAGRWHRLGVDSFDGSAHFKQAFTAGVFFVEEKGQLIKYKAAKTERGNPDALLEEISAPLCNCRACSMLREESIDVRTYGSNEHNMGRAAHNQNQLMKAQKWHMRRAFVLISCVGRKASEPKPASELYRSDWFRKARDYAEQIGDGWYILSAKHGLLDTGRIVEPYEMTLNEMNKGERQAWAQRVLVQVNEAISPNSHIIMLAGRKYREFLVDPLTKQGYFVEVPMEGLGIGQQLQWLDEHIEKAVKQLTYL